MELERNEPKSVEEESPQEHTFGSGKTEQPADAADPWLSRCWFGPDAQEKARMADIARRG